MSSHDIIILISGVFAGLVTFGGLVLWVWLYDDPALVRGLYDNEGYGPPQEGHADED
jgi:hypothetical protein